MTDIHHNELFKLRNNVAETSILKDKIGDYVLKFPKLEANNDYIKVCSEYLKLYRLTHEKCPDINDIDKLDEMNKNVRKLLEVLLINFKNNGYEEPDFSYEEKYELFRKKYHKNLCMVDQCNKKLIMENRVLVAGLGLSLILLSIISFKWYQNK